ncbi:MAG: tetratricopeptide repeat protein [Oscillatoriaceae bacterium SKW80]|nr:tetratricopeptide repeat protein [Oscillatoriaceae bacterium SKYG93]MCX8120084.1 tetratricopeptide repeat protein [Oscillatoriaceae bacterium SKW80]MDW8453010.1 tetratricopeptide repeat protein [Oscillatoriaceae cyanobacterium SKYGB_i_bin93]
MWAGTQNNLAVAYSDRVKGNRLENLERAITCYEKALKVYTLDAFPQEWAITQRNLALVQEERRRCAVTN